MKCDPSLAGTGTPLAGSTAVVAGLDGFSGGSWLGVNDHGLVSGIRNRHGSLGPADGKRSRGEIVLEALDHADAEAAAGALGELDGTSYRGFNMMIADTEKAFWLHNEARDDGEIDIFEIPEGGFGFHDL